MIIALGICYTLLMFVTEKLQFGDSNYFYLISNNSCQYVESLNSIMDIKIINKSLKAIRIVLVNTTKLNPNSYVFENKITPSRDQW